MKVIDLLNKIANGESVPLKIKYDKVIWDYDKDSNDYYSDEWLFGDYLGRTTLNEFCNDEIEIIEEPKEELEEIELIDIHYVDDKCIFKVYGQSIEETIAIKVNELIDEVNKLKKERDR